jgi:hypothetical protein
VTSLSLFTGGMTLDAAASATGGDRIREGIIVPWGESGRTSRGLKRIHRGAIRLTADAKIVGVYGHNSDTVPAPAVSRVIAHEDRPEGLWARIRVARTPLGDQLLAEIDDGVRDALSVELSELEFDAAGDVTGGRMDFFAHVPVGAYDSARALALAASLAEPGVPVTSPPVPAPPDLAQLPSLIAQLQAMLPGPPAVSDETAPAPALTASAALGLSTAGVPAAQTTGTPRGAVRKLAAMQAAQAQGNTDPGLMAALHDVTNSSLDLFQSPAAAVGQELWSGGEYERRFVPLMKQAELTSWKFVGWRWINKPRVQDWAGDKTEIPTNAVSVGPVEGEAERCAGGWDIDRKFKDFATPGFWEGFYAAQTESYRELTDQRAAAAIVDAALDISVDANVPAGYATANVAQADILRAAALGGAILEDTPNVRRTADYILMNTTDWLGLMDLTQLDLPAFLSLLGVLPGAFLRSPLVPAGAVIMGVRPAMTFRELGGGSPIRVEALDVARGGIDSAVYGYTGISLDRPGGVISVPLVPAP